VETKAKQFLASSAENLTALHARERGIDKLELLNCNIVMADVTRVLVS
jgi:hypothetical protein